MMTRSCKTAVVSVGILLLVGGVAFSAEAKRSGTPAGVSSATRDNVLRYIRQRFGVPDTVKLTLGPFHDSVFPNIYETTVTVDDGRQKRDQKLLVSKDGRYLVVGEVFSLGVDLKQEALKTISLRDGPSQGLATAPVTIVEYSDFQCPMCARLHKFLETELLPKYRDKVRLVFKEFPLVVIHDWSLTAAIANQCIYQIDPEAFVRFRSSVFENQAVFNAANSRDLLLTYGEQAGVDRVKLAGCLDAKAALPRIEENTQEAKRLNVQSTPTCFINGRMIVGMPSVDAYYQAVDEALRAAK